MGIYIKDMEMPKNCLECVFYRSTSSTYDYCCISTAIPKGYVPEDCPLVAEKTGKWENIDIIHDRKDAKITDWQQAQCSVCGKWQTKPYLYGIDLDPYCPSCGSRMED